MGYDLYVYTKEPVSNPDSFSNLRPWSPAGDGWVCRTRHWQVVVNAPQWVDACDENERVMAEIARVRAEVRYRTAINVEGRQSNEAILIAIASAQKLASTLSGIIYDPQQDYLVLPMSEGPLASLTPESQGPTQERARRSRRIDAEV